MKDTNKDVVAVDVTAAKMTREQMRMAEKVIAASYGALLTELSAAEPQKAAEVQSPMLLLAGEPVPTDKRAARR